MITVRIERKILAAFGADVHAGIHIIMTLEKAGIPVLGTLLPMGVADGVLTMTDDTMDDCLTWTWDGEENMA